MTKHISLTTMQSHKGRLYSLLAGLSMLFLLVFLGYWNVDNYNRTKQELKEDLSVQMELSIAEYQDTLIQEIIAWNTDFTHFQGTFEIAVDTVDLTTFNLPDSATFDILNKQVFGFDIDIEGDNSGAGLPNIYTRINEIYLQRLQDAELPTDHIITTLEEIGTPDTPTMAVAYSYGTGDNLPYAVFNQSRMYAFKKILPSVILSILLLGGVAASFFLIIHNWRSQLRLAAVKDEFISNMTHELKTPISTVGVALEALENFGVIDDKERRKEYLDISKHELDRLKILVDKVIKMSTLDHDLDALNFSDLDIRQITEDTIHSMSLHFKKRDATVEYSYSGDDFVVRGDKVHLVNVLYNIIDNAIKYSGDGAKVQVDLRENQREISLSIQDHGPGIDQVYLSKIFDRLFRVPSDGKHNVKGHGLGLHYAKTVIEKHQGTISASSEIGHGTTFLIKIPKNLG